MEPSVSPASLSSSASESEAAGSFRGHFSYFPESSSVPLDHMVRPTATDPGIQVTVFGLRDPLARYAKFRSRASLVMENSSADAERVVAVQVADAGKTFRSVESDPTTVAMPHSRYLALLEFVQGDWQRVCSKLNSDLRALAKNGDKRFQLESQSRIYMRGRGTAVHTWVLDHTAQGERLQFVTQCCLVSGVPALSCSLGYTTHQLGHVVLGIQALTQLGQDYETMRRLLSRGTKRATIQVGEAPSSQEDAQPQEAKRANVEGARGSMPDL